MNSVSMPRRRPSRACAARSETTAGSTVVAMTEDPTCARSAPAALTRRGMHARAVGRRLGARCGGRLLVGPVAVGVEERARGVLLVAVLLAADPDAHEQVDQPDGQARADDMRGALEAVHGGVEGDRDQARDDDDHRQPDADEPDHAAWARTVGSVGSAEASNAASASSSAPGSPTEASRPARTSAGVSPSA